MGLDKCSVADCKINLLPRHRFPNPNKELYKKKVCHRHFEACYFSLGAKRLHGNAVPTLYLTVGKIIVDYIIGE